MASRKKPTARQKKFDLERATSLLHNALFEMRRMDFQMISMLVFASGENPNCRPSANQLMQLKGQAERLLRSIYEVETHFTPYVKE